MEPSVNKFSNKFLCNIFKSSVIIFLFSLFSQQALSTVYTVDNRPDSGAEYTSVNPAIQAAAAGDTIYIHPSSTSYNNVTVDRRITLLGPGHDPANSEGLRATLSTITIGQNCSYTLISGLAVSSVDGYSDASNSDSILIINNLITSSVRGYFNGSGSKYWIIEGNYFTSSAYIINGNGSDYWYVRNNVIYGYVTGFNHTTLFTNNLFINGDSGGGATIFSGSNDVASPIVSNNMFIFTDPDVTNITYSGSMPITYTKCLTWKSGGGTDLAALPGSGNLDNLNPDFNNIPTSITDFYNNDYTLASGSPAIGAATDGGDIGIFGRNFPYDIHGRPHSMPYPISMTILNTVVQPGQDINVQFKASQNN